MLLFRILLFLLSCQLYASSVSIKFISENGETFTEKMLRDVHFPLEKYAASDCLGAWQKMPNGTERPWYNQTYIIWNSKNNSAELHFGKSPGWSIRQERKFQYWFKVDDNCGELTIKADSEKIPFKFVKRGKVWSIVFADQSNTLLLFKRTTSVSLKALHADGRLFTKKELLEIEFPYEKESAGQCLTAWQRYPSGKVGLWFNKAIFTWHENQLSLSFGTEAGKRWHIRKLKNYSYWFQVNNSACGKFTIAGDKVNIPFEFVITPDNKLTILLDDKNSIVLIPKDEPKRKEKIIKEKSAEIKPIISPTKSETEKYKIKDKALLKKIENISRENRKQEYVRIFTSAGNIFVGNIVEETVDIVIVQTIIGPFKIPKSEIVMRSRGKKSLK